MTWSGSASRLSCCWTSWSRNAIYGDRRDLSGILNNPAYVGELVWSRSTFLRDPETAKHIKRDELFTPQAIEQYVQHLLRELQGQHSAGAAVLAEQRAALQAAERGIEAPDSQ
jgi:hypothetical protein